jgi:hypothetical protein
MNTSAHFVIAVLLALPVRVAAQRDALDHEFQRANERYQSEKSITLVQRYLFTFDSAAAIPFDSGLCTIEKHSSTTRYKFNGVESFSDGTYLVKISNPEKYLVVSKTTRSDSTILGAAFAEAWSTFKSIKKRNIGRFESVWRLDSGTSGVHSMEVTIDTQESRILRVTAELSADNPIFVPMRTAKEGRGRHIFIVIGYDYKPALLDAHQQLTDYITIENDQIKAAEPYRNYRMKVIK